MPLLVLTPPDSAGHEDVVGLCVSVQCSTECGRGLRTREVVCVNVDEEQIAENLCVGPKPRQTELCDMGSCARTWFYTTWSQQVS